MVVAPTPSNPLRRFAPLQSVEFSEMRQPRKVTARSRWNHECHVCGKYFVDAAIKRHEPVNSEAHGTFVVCHYMYCDFCDKLWSWFQISNSTGTVLGPRVDDEPPAEIKGKAKDRILLANPELLGVL